MADEEPTYEEEEVVEPTASDEAGDDADIEDMKRRMAEMVCRYNNNNNKHN